MANEEWRIVGRVVVETAEAIADLFQVKEEAKSAKNSLGNSFGLIKKAVIAAFSTKVITDFGKALWNLTQNTASHGDTVDKMSQKIQISRRSYQELDFIMSQCGASVSMMQSGMVKLRNEMTQGSGQLAALGVNVRDADGNLRDAEAVMWEAFAALQAMENGAEKARIAQVLFGRSGTEMLPMLNGEIGTIEELRQMAEDLGLIMSDDAVDASVQFSDSLDNMQRQMTAIREQFGAQLLPHFTQIMDRLTAFLSTDEAQQMIARLADGFGHLASIAFDGLIGLFEWLTNTDNMSGLSSALRDVAGILVAISAASILSNLNPILGVLSAIAGLCTVISHSWGKGVDGAVRDWSRASEWETSLSSAEESGLYWMRSGDYENDGRYYAYDAQIERYVMGTMADDGHIIRQNYTFDGDEIEFDADVRAALNRQSVQDALSQLESLVSSGVTVRVFADASLYGDSAAGSYANGLDFVPRDRMPAVLHYGEAILNRTDAKAWRDGSGGSMAALSEKMNEMISAITSGFGGMNQSIVLDSGALVGGISGGMDRRLGRMADYRARRG